MTSVKKGSNVYKIMKLNRFTLRLIQRLSTYLYRLVFSISRVTIDYDASKNWGDKLSPWLVEQLTGRKCQKNIFNTQHRYFIIGSILDRVDTTGSVWGAGFISSDSLPKGIPKKIYAVRGPLTREIFLKHGVFCPEVYGDPAILLSILNPEKVRKNKKYGIIPHYVDKKNSWVTEQLDKYRDEAIFIDIEGKIEEVIKQVCICEYIISSSLHGLICADTYNIPSVRIILSDMVVGGDFKFDDYRLGIGYEPHKAVDPVLSALNLVDLIRFSSVADVRSAQKKLLTACPFTIKQSLV